MNIYHLSGAQIEQYAKSLDLSEQTVGMLRTGEVSFERIADLRSDIPSLADRICPMDKILWNWDFRKDGSDLKRDSNGVILRDKNTVLKEYETFFSPDKLNTEGLIVKRDGRDVGYCLSYPLTNILANKSPEMFQCIGKAINWKAITGFLNRAANHGISEETTNYLFDYGISDISLRGNGLGRVLMRYSIESFIPERNIAIGFIDFRNVSSILAGTRAGRVIAKEIPSPYKGHPCHKGEDRTFLTFTFSGVEPIYTGKEVSFDRKEDLPYKLREVVGTGSTESIEALMNGKVAMVGYNPESKKLEEVRFY